MTGSKKFDRSEKLLAGASRGRGSRGFHDREDQADAVHRRRRVSLQAAG
jgi:hypothetical protein